MPAAPCAARQQPKGWEGGKCGEVTSLLGLLIFPLWMAALVWAYSGAVVGNLYRGKGKPAADDHEDAPAGGPAATPETEVTATAPTQGD